MPIPLDCTASLLPLPGLPLAAEIQCPVCGRRVTVRGPPPEGFRDPWPGLDEPRINPHWSKPMPEGEPGD